MTLLLLRRHSLVRIATVAGVPPAASPQAATQPAAIRSAGSLPEVGAAAVPPVRRCVQILLARRRCLICIVKHSWRRVWLPLLRLHCHLQ